MAKECYQEMNPQLKTPYYKKAGGIPCVADGCPVKDRIMELNLKKINVDVSFLVLLLHSTCRISSLSADNSEFLQRTGRVTK